MQKRRAAKSSTCRYSFFGLVKEPDRHLLFDFGAAERLAEILESDLSAARLVGLDDCSLGDAVELLLADVGADHHVQNVQQLVARDGFVVIEVVHLEGDCGEMEKLGSPSNQLRPRIPYIAAFLHGCSTCSPCRP